jgi:hypothetical protein
MATLSPAFSESLKEKKKIFTPPSSSSNPIIISIMASYDSDSSDGEFEETNVLLGYATKDADEDTVSKLGGRPVSFWPVPHLTNSWLLTMKSGLVR